MSRKRALAFAGAVAIAIGSMSTAWAAGMGHGGGGMGHAGGAMGHAGIGGGGVGIGHPGMAHAAPPGHFAMGRGARGPFFSHGLHDRFAFRHDRFAFRHFHHRFFLFAGAPFAYDSCYERIWTGWGWRWVWACY